MNEEHIKKKILEAINSLAKYEIDVWNQVGPGVQAVLVDHIVAMSTRDRFLNRDIVLAVSSAVLSPEMHGAIWHAESVTLRTGSIPASPEIQNIRDKTLTVLFDLFKSAKSDPERRKIISTIREAEYTGTRSEINDDFLNLTLSASARTVDFFIGNSTVLSYELMETLEHDYWYAWKRARGIARSGSRAKCKDVAVKLIGEIEKLRDRFNADATYVKFKVLVGFESIYPLHWEGIEEENFESQYEASESYRHSEADKYIAQIDENNEADWFALIERVASVESNDLATFPPFTRFLTELAKEKPETTARLLEQGPEQVAKFLPAILNGLEKSNNQAIYDRQVRRLIASGKHLGAVARQLRLGDLARPAVAASVLKRAMDIGDNVAVMECLILAMEMPDRVSPTRDFYRPAIQYLNAKSEYRWIQFYWLTKEANPFFASLSDDEAQLLQPALVHASQIDYRVERILFQLAKDHPKLVWDCFTNRLAKRRQDGEDSGERYDAVPYQFHGLERELSKHPDLAVRSGRALFEKEPDLFRFRGGQLLKNAFPSFPNEFGNELMRLVSEGDREDAQFVIEVMENYHGEEQTHELLKALIVRYPNDRDIRSGVAISVEGTGAVWGEGGFVDSLRTKIELIRNWCSDNRPEVRKFATELIESMELQIADEERRAEERKALRQLQYDEGLPPAKKGAIDSKKSND